MADTLTTEQMQEAWDEEAKAREAGETPPVQVVQAPVEEPPQVEPESAPTPVADDPLASLPPEVRAKLAKIDEIENANSQLLHELKTTQGRVSAMQSYIDTAKKAQQTVAPGQAPTDAQIASAVQNPQEWEALKADYPEFGVALDKKIQAEMAAIRQIPAGLKPEDVANLVREQVVANQVEIKQLLQEAKIEGKYEDWREVVQTKDFAAWLEVQKPEVKVLANSDQAKDAIKMLDLFHTAKAKPVETIRQERESRLAAAAAPTKGGTVPPPKSLDSMTPEELWNLEAKLREQEKAQRGF